MTGRLRLLRWLRRNSLLLAVVALAVLPLVWRGASCGQDFDFHLESWMEVVAHWHAGVAYPHWDASANYGAGEPRFVFYPPFSWALGGLLGLVLPWRWVGLVYTTMALLAAAWSFRAMARSWVSEESAAVAACLYAVNPYMLFVAYERAALAELLAAVWMPLLVLYGLRRAAPPRSLVPLALVVAALWLTNAPAAVMGTYFLAGIVSLAAVEQRSWHLAARAAASTAAGLALAGFWLLPALYEERWVEIHRAIGPLMRVEDSFLFGFVNVAGVPAEERFNAAYHNHVLAMSSWIAVALLAATAAAAVWAWPKRRTGLWSPLVAAGAAIAVLQLRWSDPVWRLAPEMRFLQFPWRWLLVLGLVLAGLVALATSENSASPGRRRMRALMAIGLACGMAVLAALTFWQRCDEDDNVRAQMATFRNGGFAGTDEYTPRGADNEKILPGLPPVLVLRTADAEEGSLNDDGNWVPPKADQVPAQVQVERWRGEQRSATVTTMQPAFAVLRLMEYPAWRVWVNGVRVRAGLYRDDGLLVVPVTPGANRITVRWMATPDEWAGRAVSLAALAITLALIWKERRRNRDENFR